MEGVYRWKRRFAGTSDLLKLSVSTQLRQRGWEGGGDSRVLACRAGDA